MDLDEARATSRGFETSAFARRRPLKAYPCLRVGVSCACLTVVIVEALLV